MEILSPLTPLMRVLAPITTRLLYGGKPLELGGIGAEYDGVAIMTND